MLESLILAAVIFVGISTTALIVWCSLILAAHGREVMALIVLTVFGYSWVFAVCHYYLGVTQ